jgi:hypothetical protein
VSEQHDDHIWLVVLGESWAIRAIERCGTSVIFQLWRGYEPWLEYEIIEFIDPDWHRYCQEAVRMLGHGR